MFRPSLFQGPAPAVRSLSQFATATVLGKRTLSGLPLKPVEIPDSAAPAPKGNIPLGNRQRHDSLFRSGVRSTLQPNIRGACLCVLCRALATAPTLGATQFHSSTSTSRPVNFRKDPIHYYSKVGVLPPVRRPTYSWTFYRYMELQVDLKKLRNDLLELFLLNQARGRIYIASEGINGHLCCPGSRLRELRERLGEILPGIHNLDVLFRKHPAGDPAFKTLHVRIRNKLLNDGLDDSVKTYEDTMPQANHVSAAQWHKMVTSALKQAEQTGTAKPLIIDLRNHYETAVGKVDDAVLLDCNDFRGGLSTLRNIFDKLDKNDKRPIFFFCSGGIRSTRAGSIFAQEGWDNIFAIKGGISAYGLFLETHPDAVSLFKGKNFTFDEQRGERITNDVVGWCHTCPSNGHDGKCGPAPVDKYHVCVNRQCALMFLQCERCRELTCGTCGTKRCMDALAEAREFDRSVGTRQPDGTYVSFARRGEPAWFPHPLSLRPITQLRGVLEAPAGEQKVACENSS